MAWQRSFNSFGKKAAYRVWYEGDDDDDDDHGLQEKGAVFEKEGLLQREKLGLHE